MGVLDPSQMASFASIPDITNGPGIINDDNQPYPIFGWLEIGYERLVHTERRKSDCGFPAVFTPN